MVCGGSVLDAWFQQKFQRTRWNSTYHMLQRHAVLAQGTCGSSFGQSEHRQGVWHYCWMFTCPGSIQWCHCGALQGEKGMWPQVIPLLSTLNHSQQKEVRIATTPGCTSVDDHLRMQLRDRLQTPKSMSIMSLATLRDPHFKNIGFSAPQKQQRHWGGSWLNALLSCETACHCPPYHYHLRHHLHHKHPHQKLLSLWPKVIYTVRYIWYMYWVACVVY